MTPDALERERPYLTGLAYRLLGSSADAEDVVQEAFVKAAPIDDARTPRALLTTIVTRLCLDELRSARRRRETYVGPWLPEPVITAPDDPAEAAESISMGFLLLLESLTPHERAVFVLREVLDLDFAEIAEAIGKSEAACRQLLHRARGHVAARRRRFPRRDQQADLAARFMAALAGGDVAALTEILIADAQAISDHGGKARAAQRIVRGAERVARLLVGLARKGAGYDDVRVDPAWINGNPAVVVYVQGQRSTVIVLDTAVVAEQPRIAGFHLIRNPDKLAALRTLSSRS
jgi:RNA polymerase sigma-70 factor (ECF subfamily)